MRPLLVAITVLLLATSPVRAQSTTFPYEAIVDADDVYARSGPGKRYYPTMKVRSGLRVSVYRHDPGGWYMIAPPPGSFSWIRVEHVRRTSRNAGELIADNVVARVGSAFSDVRDVEQRRLSTGDRVEILDEKTLDVDGRDVPMYKIKPPRNEYRWISGQYLARPDKIAARRRSLSERSLSDGSGDDGGSPFDRKPNAYVVDDKPRASTRNGIRERPLVRTLHGDAVRRSLPSQAQIEADRRQLRKLDDRFRSELRQKTGEWNFVTLDTDYKQLRKDAALPALASQVDMRLAAVERYSAIKQEYVAFVKLTRETDLREAQLTAMVRRPRPRIEPPSVRPSRPRAPEETGGVGPLPPKPPIPSQPINAQPRRKYAGAGIVQRSATTFTGAPRYVLLAPNGRILAYLQGVEGVDLSRAIGKAMGITGSRDYRSDLQTDLIRVRSYTPIRLRP
jgi:hypothetical protein